MPSIQTKLTSQGQVSVPAAIRQLLGLTPGAVLEWSQEGGQVTVSRAVRHSTAEVHHVLFGEEKTAGAADAPGKTLTELKQGIRQHMRNRHVGG
jgi:AbrB family looped-hinge helix DNA binding protein